MRILRKGGPQDFHFTSGEANLPEPSESLDDSSFEILNSEIGGEFNSIEAPDTDKFDTLNGDIEKSLLDEDESGKPPAGADLLEEELPPLDDLSALEKDLISTEDRIISSVKDAASVFEENTSPGDTASILRKIEIELHSIKNELSALKEELGDLKTPVKEEETEGFLSNDDDEAIALTGDELESILNTADITEEVGKPTAVPEDNDIYPLPPGQEFASMEEDILPEAPAEGIEVPSDAPASESEEIPRSMLPIPEDGPSLDGEISLDGLPSSLKRKPHKT